MAALSLVRRVTVRSSLTPDVSYDPATAGGGGGGGGGGAASPVAAEQGLAGLLLSVLQPAVYVETLGGEVLPIEPYGRPADYGPWLAAGLTLAALGAGWLMWRGLRSLR